MTKTLQLTINEVKDTLTRLYEKTGLPSEELTVLIDTLLDAEMRGIQTHGLLRVKLYYEKLKSGSIRVPSNPEIVTDRQAVGAIDGRHGLGQWIAYQGMREAIRKADLFGIGAVTVRDSQHFGTAGYYAKMAADENMIGLVFSNASPRLAPWGGVRKLLGNNPWAVGVPTPDKELPFVLDIANSVAAVGKIRRAITRGEQIQPGWALDRNGKPTTNPFEAMQGIILPFAEHKGYGVTLAVSLLTSLLGGGAFDAEIEPMDNKERQQRVSHFLIAIHIAWFQNIHVFKERVGQLIEQIHSSDLADGFNKIYYPGERGYQQKRSILESGVMDIQASIWEEIVALLA
jgi:LDH2 family malate/lactate/ureidoglycolate dehydrogenase